MDGSSFEISDFQDLAALPESDESDSNNNNHHMSDTLISALVPTAYGNNSFLPLDRLELIIDQPTVFSELRRCYPEDPISELHDMAIHIMSTSRNIFTILAIVEESGSVRDFLEEGVNDEWLPLIHSVDWRELVHRQTEKPIQSAKRWSSFHKSSFIRYQWAISSPMLSNMDGLEHRDFDVETCLPFTEVSDKKAGGYSDVQRVKIHPRHYKFNSKQGSPPWFALKKLHSPEPEALRYETEPFTTIGGAGNTHILPLLSTFSFQGCYYILMPWAEGSLVDFWRDTAPRSRPDVLLHMWMARESLRLSQGLEKIHNLEPRISERPETEPLFKNSSGIPHTRISHSTAEAGTDSSRVSGEVLFGRHGDIKPQNILWLVDSDLQEDLGSLLISDFGLTRFYTQRTQSREKPTYIGVTPTYESPESDLDRPLSRAYDVWSLGCLLLEFATWLMYGFPGIEKFSDARASPSKYKLFDIDDAFFEIKDGIPVVKKSVLQWIGEMHQHPRCSDFVHSFLDLISRRLLVPEYRDRAKIEQVTRLLSEMWQRCQTDPDFTLRLNPWSPDDGRFLTFAEPSV
ncbi:kinase-like domain-containing protein [Nemania abortiva]|nr:kinase-like domain-containing protein [Nemania abortiva]